MKTFAYVPMIPGRIAEIARGEVLFEMHADAAINWHEVPDSAVVGDVWDGSTLSAFHPTKTAIEKRQEEEFALRSELESIDAKKTRAITDAILFGDKSRLEDLEAQQAPLRAALAALRA